MITPNDNTKLIVTNSSSFTNFEFFFYEIWILLHSQLKKRQQKFVQLSFGGELLMLHKLIQRIVIINEHPQSISITRFILNIKRTKITIWHVTNKTCTKIPVTISVLISERKGELKKVIKICHIKTFLSHPYLIKASWLMRQEFANP